MTQKDESPHLAEEPQEERGAKGSRDKGGHEPNSGPVDRPAGDPHSDDDTTVNPQGTALPEMDTLPVGDQGG